MQSFGKRKTFFENGVNLDYPAILSTVTATDSLWGLLL